MSSSVASPPLSSSALGLRYELGSAVVPGDRLGSAASSSRSSSSSAPFASGAGTYVRRGNLYASIAGSLDASREECGSDGTRGSGGAAEEKEGGSAAASVGKGGVVVRVVPRRRASAAAARYRSPLVSVGDLVLCRILRVSRPSHAQVDVLAVVPESPKEGGGGNSSSSEDFPPLIPLPESVAGSIRKEGVRPNTSVDIDLTQCFRPNDLVLARVHASGGDARRGFVLTTAEGELGVIRAMCETSGMEMKAVSWKEMECPVTGTREARKVAKPRVAVGGSGVR